MKISDRYELRDGAINGGMSSVFPYFDKVLERNVALKVVPPGPNARRMQDELAALFKMRSKHVVQVYDVISDSAGIGILQEFIDGDDLFSDLLIPKSADEYLKMIWQIAAGISDIHQAGLIHRDIKPNNMKVDHEGILKIFDFGLARDFGTNAATMGFVGTQGFAAPELYQMNANFTAAVDTYAFGATALFYGVRNLPRELLNQPPNQVTINPFSVLPFQLPTEVLDALASCIDASSARRPNMTIVRDVIAKHLLYGKHRALVVNGAVASFLDKDRRSVTLNFGAVASIKIDYDGFFFVITSVSGDVFINNGRAVVGQALPGACVLTMGGPELGNRRAYVTFDLSNPGIVL